MNDLAPARGIIIALGVMLPVWVLIGALAWWLL
jgi:hypothetical protein